MTNELGDPGVWVEVEGDAALGAVRLELEAKFGDLVVAWAIEPLWSDGAALWVPLLIPPAVASLHPEQVRWLTGLSGAVYTDLGAALVEGAIAFPSGLTGPIEVWDEAECQLRAPQGVLDVDLHVSPETRAQLSADPEGPGRGVQVTVAPPVTWGRAPSQAERGDR